MLLEHLFYSTGGNPSRANYYNGLAPVATCGHNGQGRTANPWQMPASSFNLVNSTRFLQPKSKILLAELRRLGTHCCFPAVVKFRLNSFRGFPKLGVPLWGPYNKDYRIVGSMLGPPDSGKLPYNVRGDVLLPLVKSAIR